MTTSKDTRFMFLRAVGALILIIISCPFIFMFFVGKSGIDLIETLIPNIYE